jgi:hypothetical protein
MLRQIEYQFYATLVKHVERFPMKPSRHGNLPILIASPDLPVPKYDKMSLQDVIVNDGWHYHAIIAMPRTNRHPKGCKLTTLIRAQKHRFIGQFTTVADIHVKRIKTRAHYVAGYALKHAKRNWSIMDEVLLLPKAAKDASLNDR